MHWGANGYLARPKVGARGVDVSYAGNRPADPRGRGAPGGRIGGPARHQARSAVMPQHRTAELSQARRARAILALALAAVGLLALAVIRPGTARAAEPAPSEFYGVAITTDMSQRDFKRLARANIRTVRFNIFWPAIQQRAGERYDWNAVDGFVIKASYAGIRLLPLFLGSPQYISDHPYRPPISSPSEREAWQDFVRAAVARYGPGGDFWLEVYACNGGHCHPNLPYLPLTVWQVWNEPNFYVFWKPAPSPEEYATLLELAGDAIHEADPSAQVVTGGTFPGRGHGGMPGQEFLERLYQVPGITDSFDAVDVHPYARKPDGVLREINKVRGVMQQYGDGLSPLWATEFGWATEGPRDDWHVTSTARQAKFLTRTYRDLMRVREAWRLQSAGWFTYRDGWDQPYCDWCGFAGLFDKKMKPKPSWEEYVDLTGGKS